MNKNYILLLLIYFIISCSSQEKEEYEILNLVLDKCVFKATDPKEIEKIADEENISFREALDVLLARQQNQQYTFSMSDSLKAVDLPEDVWSYLHSYDIFDHKKYHESIPIDFKRISALNNRRRVSEQPSSDHYLGYFTFYRVLFDKAGERAYTRIDVPDSKGRISGSFGLMLKKENGKWKLNN